MITGMKPPENIDWQHWVDRWDRMQERYLVKRSERFVTIIRLIRETQQPVSSVLDLGCGTGSLILSVLEAFPEATVTGIDFDPTLLWLAEARLSHYAKRSNIILADLRDAAWLKTVEPPFDAVVSATALHWFRPEHLSALYQQIFGIMRPGGLFLNADHAGSESPQIQIAWEKHREEMLARETDPYRDDWDGFWNAYTRALGLDINQIHQRVIGGWEGGVEEGLPLFWHFDKLRESGFIAVDCFWRSDCDAIYGGLKS